MCRRAGKARSQIVVTMSPRGPLRVSSLPLRVGSHTRGEAASAVGRQRRPHAHHRSTRAVSFLFQCQPSPTPGLHPVTCPNGGGTFLMGVFIDTEGCQWTPVPRGSGSLYPIILQLLLK